MALNGISGYSSAVDAVNAYQKIATPQVKAEDTVKEDVAAVYEKSDAAVEATKKSSNADIVQMLKDDMEAQKTKFLSYVQETIMGQGNALASSDDIWQFLASGNFTVSEAAKKQAQEAISEDGYWGVNKTADRILEMAKALTGGDPEKIGLMKDAFDKGFKEATKTWGKDLPDISSKTYDRVQELFKNWEEESTKTATETASNI